MISPFSHRITASYVSCGATVTMLEKGLMMLVDNDQLKFTVEWFLKRQTDRAKLIVQELEKDYSKENLDKFKDAINDSSLFLDLKIKYTLLNYCGK
jgi:hypothetical protein